MQFLGSHGFRVIAADRRSQVQSDQTWAGTTWMLRTVSNPKGTPIEVFDGVRKSVADNRAQF